MCLCPRAIRRKEIRTNGTVRIDLEFLSMAEKSIKNIRKEFRKLGVFYTSSKLAEMIKSRVPFKPKKVYDPTCGCGKLLRVFDDDVLKFGQELDINELAKIDIPNFTGYSGDTLKDDKFKDEKFDCIVANPPFSIEWTPEELKDDERFKIAPAIAPKSKADWAFMLHILHHLSDDGMAFVLEFPGILYRGNSEEKIRKWFVENNFIERIIEIPGGYFEDTNISTVLIILKKNRQKTSIIFERNGKEIEVEKGNLESSLSPSMYFPIEDRKEKIDIVDLELSAENGFLKKLRAELRFTYFANSSGLNPIDVKSFVEKIKDEIKKFEKEFLTDENKFQKVELNQVDLFG